MSVECVLGFGFVLIIFLMCLFKVLVLVLSDFILVVVVFVELVLFIGIKRLLSFFRKLLKLLI